MSTDWSFLKDGDSSFGMFYPKHYTLAGFRDADHARAAAVDLVGFGFAESDVHVVSGTDLIAKIKQFDEENGWLDRIRAKISEFIGTETYFIDQDVSLGQDGGFFVLVYSPEPDDGQRAKAVLAQHGAVYARRYLNMAIERLIEPDIETQRQVEPRE